MYKYFFIISVILAPGFIIFDLERDIASEVFPGFLVPGYRSEKTGFLFNSLRLGGWLLIGFHI